MPTVPTYDDFKVAQTGTGYTPVQGPSGPTAAEISGQELSNAGAGAQRAGDAAARIGVQMQDMANQVRVNDAMNQARQTAQDLAYNPQTGYLNLKGNDALTRPNGVDLTSEYGDKLSEALGKIGAGLGNDAQRRAFQMSAGDLQSTFHGQVENHMLGEFRDHALSVQDGTINLASDDAKRNWNNVDLIGKSLDAAKAAVVQKGKISGWSASQTEYALLTATSKVHTDVIAAALENNNPNYALSYLDARKGQMTADDILRVQGHVNQQVWGNASLQAVQSATTAAMPSLAPTNFDRMTTITAQAESGGRETNANGTTVTSAKGAQGVMQVMPLTNKDPGFGVRPAADDSPQERARVGRDYLQAMLQRYGDPAKAWAAYNAGPGALDKALAQAKSDAATGAFRSGPPGADYWLSLMPKETQSYVTANVKALGSGGGQPPRPTELEFVNNAMAQLPPGAPPQLVKMTREQATTQFGIINKSANETGENAFASAQRWLSQNAGTTVDQLPAPMRDTLLQYAPGKMDDLVKFSKTLGRGDVVTNNARYNDIVQNMDQYARMSDAGWNQLQTELSNTDFKHLSKERADLMAGKGGDGAEGLNRAQLNRAVNENLASLKITTSPGKDADAAERLGGIRKFIDQSVIDTQRAMGKKMTPAEITDHVNKLFATDVTFRTTSLFGSSTSSQNLMQMTMKDLPDGAADGLRQALVSNGNKAPTDNDILNLYRKIHVGRR